MGGDVSRARLWVLGTGAGVAIVLSALSPTLVRLDWGSIGDCAWNWLNSWWGLFTLTTAALVCQLAGVVFVVQDLRHYTRNQRLLIQMQRNIHGAFENTERERKAHYANMREQQEAEAREGLKEWGAYGTGEGVDSAVNLLTGFVNQAQYLDHMSRQLWRVEKLVNGLTLYAMEFKDTRPWAAWSGPALLLLGIAFGGGAALLAL